MSEKKYNTKGWKKQAVIRPIQLTKMSRRPMLNLTVERSLVGRADD